MGPFENKYIIGLTGNIAVGKSVVRQMLQHLGAYTIDADGLTHQAMAPGAPAYKPIVEMFGKFVLDSEGRIDRSRLGAIAFTIPEALEKLEAIIHPVVGQAVYALTNRARQRIIVIEAIKLVESDLVKLCDSIWVVDASVETQVKRLIDKRKMTLEEARRRILAQPPQADKLARAHVIIRNDGSVEDTWKQVQAEWNRTVVGAIGQSSPSAVPTMGAPAAQSTQAGAARSTTGTSPLSPKTEVGIRRGMPANAEQIARFISRVSGRNVDRMEIMLAFGQKSYLLALGDRDSVIGVVGWQVENLITRVDELYIDPNVPREPVIKALVRAIEDASRELQSEVSFIFLPRTMPQPIVDSFLQNGYQHLKLNEIKFPAWREAAHEMMTPEVQGLMKQLRTDRVMKPI